MGTFHGPPLVAPSGDKLWDPLWHSLPGPVGYQDPGWEGRGFPFAADLTPHHPIPNSQFQKICFWRGSANSTSRVVGVKYTVLLGTFDPPPSIPDFDPHLKVEFGIGVRVVGGSKTWHWEFATPLSGEAGSKWNCDHQ